MSALYKFANDMKQQLGRHLDSVENSTSES